MLKSKLNYPYPVLRSESIDYRTSIITSNMMIMTDDKSYKLKVDISTNNVYINGLISEGKASKGILVKSSAVWFRKFYKLTGEEIIIDSKDVYGKVDLLPCIIANQKIENFFCEDFEDEYKYSSISVEVGEFIAIGDEYCFDALLDSDIFKNTSSIFELALVDDNQISYDLGSDKIVIYVPRNIHQNYLNVANSVASPKSVLNSIIVYPVLVSVLYDMKTIEDGDYESEKSWYKTIKKTIEIRKENNSISGLDSFGAIENPILVAQSLTNGLTLSSFVKLKEILETEGDE